MGMVREGLSVAGLRMTGPRVTGLIFGALMLAGLAGCATQPELTRQAAPAQGDKVQDMPETHTVLGRYPARRSGVLIAQSAALREGRAMCEDKGLRFRPLGSVAGEDPATGEAIYAVRFRCLAARRMQAGQAPGEQGEGARGPVSNDIP